MKKLLIVSNRLPVTVVRDGDRLGIRPSSGGLVTALNAVFECHPAAWIGWTGISCDRAVSEVLRAYSTGPKLCPVFLTERQRMEFYCGFSNEIIWPLFHDLQSRCNFDPTYWHTYLEVNQHFTDAVLEEATGNDLVWVHDYHLAFVGCMLRRQNPRLQTAYFQHIPFPSVDIFEKLPWRMEFVEALLAFGVVGFQTERDLRNFTTCVRALGPGRVRRSGNHVIIEHHKGITKARAFPISIDFDTFARPAASGEVEAKLAQMRSDMRNRQVVLGVDRLDYTKGIPERLRAFARALELYPALRRNVTFIQVVVPSRENIPKYSDLKLEIERLVSQINGRFTDGGWVPIHFVYRHLGREELLAYYRLADVALVTPLKDGMNLVAKEYCAANVDEQGVLILSEFAGAAAEMKGWALVVNPNDLDHVARQIEAAFSMTPNERRGRMACLREMLRSNDVHRWVEDFLAECETSREPAATQLRVESGEVYAQELGA